MLRAGRPGGGLCDDGRERLGSVGDLGGRPSVGIDDSALDALTGGLLTGVAAEVCERGEHGWVAGTS